MEESMELSHFHLAVAFLVDNPKLSRLLEGDLIGSLLLKSLNLPRRKKIIKKITRTSQGYE